MIQAKLKKDNNSSMHNHTEVIKNNTYMVVKKISSYVVATSTV